VIGPRSSRRRVAGRTLSLLGAVLAVLGTLPRVARAYVRATNEMGVPVYWAASCEAATIYMNGFSEMTAGEVAKSIAAAAAAWSAGAVACPGADGGGGPSFEVVPAIVTGGGAPGVVYDGKSSIMFETQTWLHDPDAIALTVRFTSSDGKILDADIDINATDPAAGGAATWGNLDPGAAGAMHGIAITDLQRAITHEMGHFLGLAHTCFDADTDAPPRPNDDQGRPIPDCANPAPDIPAAHAVMWYFVDSGSADKRVLSSDDVAGVCAIYPPSRAAPACALDQPDDGCACAAAEVRHPFAISALGLVALLGAWRRKRRLTSDPDPPGDR
jgi:MYXO-CTERM domain-containing protein